jgi:hypothetical protein
VTTMRTVFRFGVLEIGLDYVRVFNRTSDTGRVMMPPAAMIRWRVWLPRARRLFRGYPMP